MILDKWQRADGSWDVEVRRVSPKGRQQFTPRLLYIGLTEGWLSMTQGQVVIHDRRGDVAWNILRVPGRYPIDLQDLEKGMEVINYYDCEGPV